MSENNDTNIETQSPSLTRRKIATNRRLKVVKRVGEQLSRAEIAGPRGGWFQKPRPILDSRGRRV